MGELNVHISFLLSMFHHLYGHYNDNKHSAWHGRWKNCKWHAWDFCSLPRFSLWLFVPGHFSSSWDIFSKSFYIAIQKIIHFIFFISSGIIWFQKKTQSLVICCFFLGWYSWIFHVVNNSDPPKNYSILFVLHWYGFYSHPKIEQIKKSK